MAFRFLRFSQIAKKGQGSFSQIAKLVRRPPRQKKIPVNYPGIAAGVLFRDNMLDMKPVEGLVAVGQRDVPGQADQEVGPIRPGAAEKWTFNFFRLTPQVEARLLQRRWAKVKSMPVNSSTRSNS